MDNKTENAQGQKDKASVYARIEAWAEERGQISRRRSEVAAWDAHLDALVRAARYKAGVASSAPASIPSEEPKGRRSLWFAVSDWAGMQEWKRLERIKEARQAYLDNRLCDEAFEGHVEEMERLLKMGARPNRLDRFGKSAVSWSTSWSDGRPMKLLLENKADPDMPDKDKTIPILHSAYYGHGEDVRLLVEHHADISGKVGKAAMFMLARSANVLGNPIVGIKALIEHRVDPNAQNSDGVTVLMLAAAKGDKELVQLLLDNGADKAIVDKHGNNATKVALGMGQIEVAKMLGAQEAEIAKVAAVMAAEAQRRAAMQLRKAPRAEGDAARQDAPKERGRNA